MNDFKWKHFQGDIILGCVQKKYVTNSQTLMLFFYIPSFPIDKEIISKCHTRKLVSPNPSPI